MHHLFESPPARPSRAEVEKRSRFHCLRWRDRPLKHGRFCGAAIGRAGRGRRVDIRWRVPCQCVKSLSCLHLVVVVLVVLVALVALVVLVVLVVVEVRHTAFRRPFTGFHRFSLRFCCRRQVSKTRVRSNLPDLTQSLPAHRQATARQSSRCLARGPQKPQINIARQCTLQQLG